MRFLHISDLHLGKIFSGYDLFEDQHYMLSQIIGISKAESIDAVLIAGDVYNKSSPSPEAMTMFSDFLAEFSDNNVPVYIISGNHDNADRVSYFSDIIKKCGIFVSQRFNGKLMKCKISDKYGDIYIHLLPFIKPVYVRSFYPDEKITSYEEAVKAVLDNSEIDNSKRNILVCHQMISGCQTDGSEEFTVGGVENISSALFNDFDYVAMGHIHKSQKAGRDTVRYSGSPLKYSLSEASTKKSVTIFDIFEKGNIEIKTVPIKPLRDVVTVKGTLNELMKNNPSSDYTGVTITDEEQDPDACRMLRQTYPFMVSFSVENSKMKSTETVTAFESVKTKSPCEMFRLFFMRQNGNNEPTDRQTQIIEKIIDGTQVNDL